MKSKYQELIVWQKSIQLAKRIYEITRSFPKEELFILVSQMRRCAVSIPSNIAEGSQRGKKEFCQFLRTSQGSAAELETQVFLSKEFGYIAETVFSSLQEDISEVMRMLHALQNSLSPSC